MGFSDDGALSDDELLDELEAACDEREGKLSQWEQDFVESVLRRRGAGGLSDKQREKVEEIVCRLS